MRSFEVNHMDPVEFVDKIEEELTAREFDRYVTVSFQGERLVVELRWMGTTRFEYRVIPTGEGFRAELDRQRVAPLHAAFRDRFEGYFEEALTKVGATVT
jgi:hypothetical protein